MRFVATVVVAPLKATKFLFFLLLFSGPHGALLRAIVGRKTANTLVSGKEEADRIEQRIREECPACRRGGLREEKDQDRVHVACTECGYVLDNVEEEKFRISG